MNYTNIGITFCVALILSLLLIPLVSRFSTWSGALDHPEQRKVHDKPMPTLGGLAFMLSFVFTGMIFLSIDNTVIGLMAGLFVILLTGVVDDIYHIKPLIKFSGEIVASLLFIYLTGYSITTFGDLLNIGELTTGRYAIPVTVFCMIGVMNAWNFVDGLDGLAGGISLIACVVLSCFAINCQLTGIAGLLIILAGSVTGFLYFNRYPARIYMGDTGSLGLGYLLSALCVALVQFDDCSTPVLPVSMAIIMGLPIVDAILVMTNRVLHGHNPFHPDNTHLHHRLMRLKLGHRGSVNVIYVLMITCGALALFLQSLNEPRQFLLGAVYAFLIFATVYLLNFIKNMNDKT